MQCVTLFPETTKTNLAFNGLLQLVDDLKVCAGHTEQWFLDQADSCEGKFQSANQSAVVFTDGYFTMPTCQWRSVNTVQSTACELLVQGSNEILTDPHLRTLSVTAETNLCRSEATWRTTSP